MTLARRRCDWLPVEGSVLARRPLMPARATLDGSREENSKLSRAVVKDAGRAPSVPETALAPKLSFKQSSGGRNPTELTD